MKVVVQLDLDFQQLIKQKQMLLDIVWDKAVDDPLWGIISLIDDVQDQSVSHNGIDEKVVFGEDSEALGIVGA
jgi:hypothetical protein